MEVGTATSSSSPSRANRQTTTVSPPLCLSRDQYRGIKAREGPKRSHSPLISFIKGSLLPHFLLHTLILGSSFLLSIYPSYPPFKPCFVSSMRTNSDLHLTNKLDALIRSIEQSGNTRRAASLVLPRTTAGSSSDYDPPDDVSSGHRTDRQNVWPSTALSVEEKGIWSWKPMRALSRMRMQRLGCLFCVEVVAVQGLPPTMNGLRLFVGVRKKESKRGALRTLPARVLQRSAEFDETLFLRCHVYCNGSSGTSKPLKFEPRPFVISVMAIDAPELDFGKAIVDLSQLVRESIERSIEGARIRQWDATFQLSGKAKGGELIVKLGFQIMEDISIGLYSQIEGLQANDKGTDPSSSIARKQSKSSFSVLRPSKRIDKSAIPPEDLSQKEVDGFNLDESNPLLYTSSQSVQKAEIEVKEEELDLPEFEVIDKGIEIPASGGKEENDSLLKEVAEESSVSSEIVKEVVHDRARLMELDSIAKQIEALEQMTNGDVLNCTWTEAQGLDADEEMITREFLQMLQLKAIKQEKYGKPDLVNVKIGAEDGLDGEEKVFISDLGKGLGPVVQTRDGGYLASINPLNVEVTRHDTAKLAMQISRPFVIPDQKHAAELNVLQRLAAIGSEELSTKLISLTSMDELFGKTAEQIAFEGIAFAIISGRSKEGASSSAARSIATAKELASALCEGRRERISTGIWNAKDDPAAIEEILASSLQMIETMAMEALKIQAGMAEDMATCLDVASLIRKEDSINLLESAISAEEWGRACSADNTVTLLVVIQLRDPLRRYEAVGAPAIAVVQATGVKTREEDASMRFKLSSLHVGGVKLQPGGGTRSGWDGEKQRLTAIQWLVAYGLGKSGKKKRSMMSKGGQDLVWSLSSSVVAGMWLKPWRNPDVKIDNH